MANRKDSKGRVLKVGESQRKDGTYMYRYTDTRGKRQSVYASDLKELREKEKVIHKNLDDGIDYAAGKITVLELVYRYLSLKKNIQESTVETYKVSTNRLSKFDFAYMKIVDVKASDAQKWISELCNSGLKYGSIQSVLTIVKPAFMMAYNEDIIRRYPFSFRISDFLQNDSTVREPLTLVQQNGLLAFIRNTAPWYKHYDLINVLLGTGMRISEFLGLTINDIDFNNNRIFINKQLVRGSDKKPHIKTTKTAYGVRYIPMTTQVSNSLKKLIEKSQKSNIVNIVDGCHGFIALKSNGRIMERCEIDHIFTRLKKAYNDTNPAVPIKMLTPHVLRHTFCTNMVNAGMDIKSLQYLMGHASVKMTLNVYAHASYENVAANMRAIAT